MLERRAEDHAFALEHLSPVIHPRDELAGNKTRFIRGAIPYANYAAGPFLREMRKEQQDAQQKHVDQGHGGGIEQSLALAKEGGFRLFSGKFLISNEDCESFREICEYWEDKCLMAQGERLWKTHFAQADFIEKGWAIGLYTAPHEPCPEGRLVLDYEMALSKGYRRIIAEIEDRIGSFQPGGIQDAAKLHFWCAAKRAPPRSAGLCEKLRQRGRSPGRGRAGPGTAGPPAADGRRLPPRARRNAPQFPRSRAGLLVHLPAGAPRRQPPRLFAGPPRSTAPSLF